MNLVNSFKLFLNFLCEASASSAAQRELPQAFGLLIFLFGLAEKG